MRCLNATLCMAPLLVLMANGHKSTPHQAILRTDQSGFHEPSLATREHWMRRAKRALSELRSPCPFEAFGSVIVNHTAGNGYGVEVCIGANAIREVGNPTLHGEIAAINNCTAVLADPDGTYKLSASEISEAWKSLSLYTTAEACPMCATAIRWAGFREYIYATNTDTLLRLGWPQVHLSSRALFSKTLDLPGHTELVPDVGADDTNELFRWQFDEHASCPRGCARTEGGICAAE